MDAATAWRGGRGQATIEHVGLTVVIALLFGALAVWVAGTPWAADGPPDVIARVTAPLRGAAETATLPRAASTPARRAMERTGGSGVPGAVQRAWEGFLWWGALNVDGQIEAGRGALEQVGIRAEDLVKDPVKTIEGAVDRLSRPPVTGSAERVARIVRTIGAIGDQPFRESFLGISRDLGGLGADWLIAKYARGLGDLLGRLLPGG